MKKLSIFLLILLIGAFFAYSIREYKKTGAEGNGLVTCAEDQCYWTAHIHTLVRVNLCSQPIPLPKLVGPLSGIHTHTEENILHWHDKLPADPQTHELLDTEALTIGFGLSVMTIPFDVDGLMEEKNGDLCPDGKPGTLKFFVNGTPLTPDPSYVWKDHDMIDIIFDSRSEAEALQYVETLPKEFPSLTNG